MAERIGKEIEMPVRSLNREQTFLMPPSLDELIPEDHPARFVGSVVDALDRALWEELEIPVQGDPLGAPSYHPRALLSIWLYGFMTRTRSSRKLEAACRDQLPCLWLTAWQYPDHNTLWRFYKAHRKKMRGLFKLMIRTAMKLGLVDLAIQAVDGTKVAANAAKDRTYDARELKDLLKRTEKAIRDLEAENENPGDAAPVHLPDKLKEAEQLLAAVKVALEQLKQEDRGQINLTDGDARLMKGRQGIIAGYNMEAVVSPLKVGEAGRSGLFMTAVDAVQDPDDHGQLIPMMEQAEENTGEKAEMSLADAGLHSGPNLAACEGREQVIAMPEAQEQALKQPYHKDRFGYSADTDTYRCPCGHTLKYLRARQRGDRKIRIYRGSGAVCRKCTAFGICTKCRTGRELQVGEYETVLRRHREWMATEKAKEAYRRRKEIIEPAFGIFKEQMGIRRFLLRGCENVRAEVITMAVAFNLRTLHAVWSGWSAEKRYKLTSAMQEVGRSVLSHAASVCRSTPSASLPTLLINHGVS